MKSRHKALILISAVFFLLTNALPAQTIYVSLAGKGVEGKPVFWNDDLVALMSRDGQLVTFAPSEAETFRQVSKRFSSQSQAMLRGDLLREFGAGFDVSGTGQFLVVHPSGQRARWADRFEQLYRSMVHYLTARRFEIQRPEFPLVAIVFPSQQQYIHHARQRGDNVSSGTLGYYDPDSNRIYMYDATHESGEPSNWHINAETIIHEAAHQTAFNVGIHDRLADDPRWVIEGLGTMFEAPGVWDSRNHPQLSDRVNRMQLQYFRRLIERTNPVELLQRQLASDQLFAQASSAAYAHAWALTFYLTEREPQRYAEYLRRIKRLQPFAEYTQEQRLRDFTAVFGTDLRMFDARMRRFIEQL